MSPTRVRSLPSPRSAHGPWMEQVKPDDAISDPLPSVTLGTQVAQKMVARGRQTMPVGPEVGLADELDGLRFQQLDLFTKIMLGDLDLAKWTPIVRRYLAVTRKRCRLRGLFQRKHRQLQTLGSGPIPDALKAEMRQTYWILMSLRRTSPAWPSSGSGCMPDQGPRRFSSGPS